MSTDLNLDNPWEQRLRSALPDRMSLRTFPQYGQHTSNISPRLLRWMWDNLTEYDLLVVRALFHPMTSAGAAIAGQKKVPYVVVPHGTLSKWTFEHRNRLLKKGYFRLIEKRTLDGSAYVRFTSEAEKREAGRLPFTSKQVVIPHPFEANTSSDLPSGRNLNQILYLSRLDPKKGVRVLLDALEVARQKRPALELVLAGSGSKTYEEEIRAAIRERGLEGAVELPGFVSGRDKSTLLRESGVFVLPSHQENFGIAAVEALDAGLPVVLSPSVDVAPHVEDYEAGHVVERTVSTVADAILDILDDSARVREMGTRGRRLVQELFSPEVVGRKVASLYRSAGG